MADAPGPRTVGGCGGRRRLHLRRGGGGHTHGHSRTDLSTGDGCPALRPHHFCVFGQQRPFLFACEIGVLLEAPVPRAIGQQDFVPTCTAMPRPQGTGGAGIEATTALHPQLLLHVHSAARERHSFPKNTRRWFCQCLALYARHIVFLGLEDRLAWVIGGYHYSRTAQCPSSELQPTGICMPPPPRFCRRSVQLHEFFPRLWPNDTEQGSQERSLMPVLRYNPRIRCTCRTMW